jgi:hypothetical protein
VSYLFLDDEVAIRFLRTNVFPLYGTTTSLSQFEVICWMGLPFFIRTPLSFLVISSFVIKI